MQCTSALSSGFPILQGNAEALDFRWDWKTKHRLISYFLSNTFAKNYRNRIVYVKITASQRWDVFKTHSVCAMRFRVKRFPTVYKAVRLNALTSCVAFIALSAYKRTHAAIEVIVWIKVKPEHLYNACVCILVPTMWHCWQRITRFYLSHTRLILVVKWAIPAFTAPLPRRASPHIHGHSFFIPLSAGGWDDVDGMSTSCWLSQNKLDWTYSYFDLCWHACSAVTTMSNRHRFGLLTTVRYVSKKLVLLWTNRNKCSYYTFRMRHSRGEMYSGHGRLCVCLSLAAFPHYCTDPDVTWNGRRCYYGCALLSRFTISGRVSLLWHQSAKREMSASACTPSMPGLFML